jgi:hypothetical protein
VYCNIIEVGEEQEHAESCVRTPDIWINRKSLIQIHGFVFVLCVFMLNDMLMNVCFPVIHSLYMLCI